MNKGIIVMIGLPGSGKSTEVKRLIESGEASKLTGCKSVVRLNKDCMREMLHFEAYNKSNEEEVRMAEMHLAISFIGSGIGLVIDNTNSRARNIQKWLTLAEDLGAELKAVVMHSGVETCVGRDMLRERTVGRESIERRNKIFDEEREAIFKLLKGHEVINV